MDNFKLPKIEFPDGDAMSWDNNKDQKKIINSAQFEISKQDAMLAIAMKNYWIFRYDIKKNK